MVNHIGVLLTNTAVDAFEERLPEGELSVHTHLRCGGHAVRLGAAQPQMGKLQWQSRLCQASLQRWQQLTFGWTAEHTKNSTRNMLHSVSQFAFLYIKTSRLCS